jgi:hypothetical protein
VAVPLLAAIAALVPIINAIALNAAGGRNWRGAAAPGWLFFIEGLGSLAGSATAAVAIHASGARGGLVTVAAGFGLAALCFALLRLRLRGPGWACRP